MVQLKRRGILKRRLVLIGAAALGLIATLVPASPTAQAAAAPWTWTRVTVPVSVQANSSYAIRALCPSGFTAITGGLALPNFSSVVTQGQYRQDDTSGSGWSVIFRNFSSSTGSATVVAECAETADLPPISYQIQEFSRDGNGWAEGEVPCPNAGEVVLTGGVDWSNTIPDKSIYASAPGWGETSWYGYGHNSGTGAKLGVEVYCVNPAYVPGFVKIEHTQGGDWVVDTLTCPVGKRILNGGGLAYTYASFPNRTSWTTTSSGTRTTRAMCIDAGSPTISIDFASPGPDGSVTKSAYANFALSGSDPAGFPNSFRCSIDGGSPSVCGGSVGFGPLSPGPHELVVWNATSDGRTSGVRTYEWTSDQTGPTVTPPKIAKVILGVSAKAQWSATDDYS
ncbi:MAG TPA: hypothetical protein VFX15_02090, partial [Actinomycetes bacterium]|nr:hypothetical protein [Actinomycetes bacterium]